MMCLRWMYNRLSVWVLVALCCPKTMWIKICWFWMLRGVWRHRWNVHLWIYPYAVYPSTNQHIRAWLEIELIRSMGWQRSRPFIVRIVSWDGIVKDCSRTIDGKRISWNEIIWFERDVLSNHSFFVSELLCAACFHSSRRSVLTELPPQMTTTIFCAFWMVGCCMLSAAYAAPHAGSTRT